MAENWFAVETKTGQESRAALNLSVQNFPPFLPVIHKQIVKNRRLIGVTRALFSRIVFCRFDRKTAPWGSIRYTLGCRDVMKSGGRPSPIPDAVIEEIRMRDETPKPEQSFGFKPGNEISIKVGPFADLPAEYLGQTDGAAQIALTLFGKRHIKTIPVSDLILRLPDVDRRSA